MPTRGASVPAAFALLLGAGAVSANEGGHAGWSATRTTKFQPAVAAARRAQLHGLLLGLPLAEVRALLAPRGRPEDSDSQRDTFLRKPGDKFTDYIGPRCRRPMRTNGSARRRRTCRWWRVLAAATGSSSSSRLSTPIRPAADGREQPAVGRYRDASRALRFPGPQKRRLEAVETRGKTEKPGRHRNSRRSSRVWSAA